MRFFDWLWGNSQIGILKFALLSGMFGLMIMSLIDNYVYDSQNGGKVLVIATGTVPLLLIRWAYWSFRRKQLWRWVREGKSKAIRPILALGRWRPSLVKEFQRITAAYLQHLGPGVASEAKAP